MERSRSVRAALVFAAIVVLGLGRAHAGISLEFVGQWGGPCQAAAVVGDRVYAGIGPSLVVLDVSNKTTPVQLGKLVLTRGVTAVAVSGDLAYVTTSAAELHVIDVSDPQHPTHAGQCSTTGSPTSVTVSGGYAYVAAGYTGLLIFDLSVPNPVLVGSYDTSDNASDVAISDHYAYVADIGAGLRVIDVADPTNPVAVGGYDTTGFATGVAISGHYAYVADGSAGLRVIDIASPALPVQVGIYNTSGSAQRVVVSGSYAYVADWSAGLQVINVSNPAAPARVGGYDTSGYAVRLAVSGSYVFVADQGPGLQIINVTSPSSPTRVGGYEQGGNAYGLAVSGGYAYLGAGGLQVIDVSDPTDPVRSGRYDSAWTPRDVVISGEYACAAADTGGLQMFDISNPAAPLYVGHWYQNPTSSVAVSGSYAYCNNGSGLVQSMNISDPAHPTPISGVYIQPSGLNRLTLIGRHLYVANDTGGLKILDVANPNTPTVIGSCDTAGNAYDVAVAGGYAYIADFDKGLVVMNVDNPAAPAYTGGLSTIGTVGSVAACGNYLFARTFNGAMQIIDVSSPTSPSLVGSYTPFYTGKMSIVNNYIYAASSSDGLVILRINFTVWSGFAGRVTDSLDNPISGATVSTDTGGYTALTDPDGYYSMPTILPGRYHLTASKSNTIPAMSSVSVAEGQTETCDFVLLSGGTISGYVRDNLGNPVSGVTVAQYPFDSQTDSTGWYALANLPEGTYNLTAAKSDWTSVTNNDVPVANDQTTTSNFTLQRGSITGAVTRSGGVPMSGVTVSTSVGGYTTTTGGAGTYTISNVLPGGYNITASKNGWLPVTNSISVTGGQTTSNFVLTAAASVSGTVTDSVGGPISGALLSTTYSLKTYTATSDPTGHYSMPGMVAAADISLIASKAGYASVMKKVSVSAGLETVCNVRLADAISLDLVSSTSISNTLTRIAVSNGIAAVQSGTGLQFIDVSNPLSPVKLSTFGTASDVEIVGSFAYVANGGAGLQILNISNPSAPSLAGSYDTTGTARAVHVVGNYAYVADGFSGLQIINISNPVAPVRVGGYNTSGDAWGLDFANAYVYVADGSGGLQIIDVWNPSNPTLAGHYSVSNCSFSDVAVSGSRACVVDSFLHLFQVVNITVAANPALVGTGYFAGHIGPVKVSISGNYAYVGAGSGGLMVYDITSPTDPGLVAQYSDYRANDIAVANGYVYVADSTGKLIILTPSYLKVTGIAPQLATNSESALPVSLTGLGFEVGDTIRLTRAGQADISATEVSVVDAAHITCRLNLTGACPGLWNVVVTETGGPSSCLSCGFAVVLADSTPCVAVVNRNASDAIMTTACARWRVRLIGKVTQTTSDSFRISDGSAAAIKVYAPDYSHTRIVNGDWVAATGTLDFSTGAAVLMSMDAQIEELR